MDGSQGHMWGCLLIVLGACSNICLYWPLSGPTKGQQKMPPTNPPLRHYGNFKLKELEKKIHQVPDSFVLLPKSR